MTTEECRRIADNALYMLEDEELGANVSHWTKDGAVRDLADCVFELTDEAEAYEEVREHRDELEGRLREKEREVERLRVNAWDMAQELETRVLELVNSLADLPDEASELREDMRSELACIEETLKRCGR